MPALLALGTIAFLLCLMVTPICRDIFLHYKIVDLPDSDRKLHLGPIPRIGGLPIVLSYAGAMGLMFFCAPHGARIYIQHQRLLFSLLPAAGIVFVTGLIDDIIGLKPWQKLTGQFIAAVLAVSLGARLSILNGLPASLWVTIPFSLAWLIGCTNAVNLIDGLDGLASGVGLFATLATLGAALIGGNPGLAMATVPLAGCLLAFLRYNFSPASIFLGDCGSLTIGFLLGSFALIWSQHGGGTLFGMALPLMALSLPLLDVVLAICRRTLRSVPIFKGDRGHIHHMVMARGFKPHTSALILYGFCAIASSLALLQTFIDLRYRAPIFLVFGGLIWLGVNFLGYVELQAIRQLLSRKRLLALLRGEIYLQDLDRALAKAQTIDDFWRVVRGTCLELGIASVRMNFGQIVYEELFQAQLDQPRWALTLALGDEGELIVTKSADARPPTFMLTVLEYLQDAAVLRESTLSKSRGGLSDAA